MKYDVKKDKRKWHSLKVNLVIRPKSQSSLVKHATAFIYLLQINATRLAVKSLSSQWFTVTLPPRRLATRQVITDGIIWCNCNRQNHDQFKTISDLKTLAAQRQLLGPQEVPKNDAKKDDSIKTLQARQPSMYLHKARCEYGDSTTSFAQVSSVKRAMGSHQGFV